MALLCSIMFAILYTTLAIMFVISFDILNAVLFTILVPFTIQILFLTRELDIGEQDPHWAHNLLSL